MPPIATDEDIENYKEFWHKIIVKSYQDLLINSFGIESNIPQQNKPFFLSETITREAVNRFVRYKVKIENANAGLKGSDIYKEAGYIAYWIAKMKPVQILLDDPNKDEVKINEYLAIAVAVNYLYEIKGAEFLSKKLIKDIIYLLRNRTYTVRFLPMIFEAYVVGYTNHIVNKRAWEEFQEKI